MRLERHVRSLFSRMERLMSFPAPAADRRAVSGSIGQRTSAPAGTVQTLGQVLEMRIRAALPAGVPLKMGDAASRRELARAVSRLASGRQPLSPAQRESLSLLLERAYPGAAVHLAAHTAPGAAPEAEAILGSLLRDAAPEGHTTPLRRGSGRMLPAHSGSMKPPAGLRSLPPLWRDTPLAAAEGRMQAISRRYEGSARLRAAALDPLAARWAVKSLDVWSFRPAQLTFNFEPSLASAGSWAAESPPPQGRSIRRSDTILRRFLKHERLDWLSQTVERRAGRALRRYVTEPARLVRFVPAAYITQYGRLQPVGRTDWTQYGYNGDGTPPASMGLPAEKQAAYRESAPPLSPREQEAQQFFRDVGRLFGGPPAALPAQGRIAGPSRPALRPPEISYKQNETDVTGKLVSQQANRPRSLNQPLKPERELKVRGEGEFDERQIARMADQVFDRIERRIAAERRRFGL